MDDVEKMGMCGNNDKEVLALCDRVRKIAFELHCYLRHGYPEKIYEKGFARRLQAAGLRVESQVALEVRDEDGTVLGEFLADLVIEGCLVVELKACKALVEEHTVQVLGYLRAMGFRHGLLVNFGSPKIQFKKLVL